MKRIISVMIFLLCAINVFSQLRSFDDIFPSMNETIRESAITDSGYVKTSRKEDGFDILASRNNARLDPSIVNIITRINPGYIVESITVIPSDKPVTLLNIYNALGKIQNLKGRLYSSATRNKDIPLFEEATRIAGEKQTNAIPDPSLATVLPQTETVYLRLKDVNFGNTFYRGEITLVQNGLRYTMSNFRNMTYLFVPVIREDKFIAQLYIEPIREGVLIYSIAGADVAHFFTLHIHVDSAISKRLAVITEWAADGIRLTR